ASFCDSAAPVLLLPEPETPISTMTSGDFTVMLLLLRSRSSSRALCPVSSPSAGAGASGGMDPGDKHRDDRDGTVSERVAADSGYTPCSSTGLRLDVAAEALAHGGQHLLGEGVVLAGAEARDRKSTRLNSS